MLCTFEWKLPDGFGVSKERELSEGLVLALLGAVLDRVVELQEAVLK